MYEVPQKFCMLHFHRWFYLFCANISTHQKQPPEVLYENGALENFAEFTGKHLCRSLFYNASCNFIKKDTPAKVFSREFCEIFKNTFFTEHLWEIASININSRSSRSQISAKYVVLKISQINEKAPASDSLFE